MDQNDIKRVTLKFSEFLLVVLVVIRNSVASGRACYLWLLKTDNDTTHRVILYVPPHERHVVARHIGNACNR